MTVASACPPHSSLDGHLPGLLWSSNSFTLLPPISWGAPAFGTPLEFFTPGVEVSYIHPHQNFCILLYLINEDAVFQA